MIRRYLYLIIAICFIVPSIIYGLDSNAGTSALQFLDISVGARAAGMGESYTALANDVTALYWNPAGIAQIENRIQATFMHNAWFEGGVYDFIGGVYQLDEFERITLGANLVTFGIGDIEGYDVNDSPSYKYSANDFALAVSGAKMLQYDLLYVGATIRMVQGRIEAVGTNTGFGIDIGGLFTMSDELSFGGCIQNIIGTGVTFVSQKYSLPTNIRAGVAYKSEEYIGSPYIVTADVNIPSDSPMRLNFGGEYMINEIFDVRAGYKLLLGAGNDLGGFSGFTIGAGAKFIAGQDIGMLVDLAIVPYGALGSTTRLSATLKF